MKELNFSELKTVSGSLTYDQLIGRGFAFGACVGLFSGVVSVMTQTQATVQLAIGAACGVGVGGFAGAILSIPFSMVSGDVETQINRYELVETS